MTVAELANLELLKGKGLPQFDAIDASQVNEGIPALLLDLKEQLDSLELLIEAEEKAPPASMVDLNLIVNAGSSTKIYNASFTDADTQSVKVSSSRGKLLQILETLFVLALVGLTATVIGLRYRKRRQRTRRLMHSRGRRW